MEALILSKRFKRISRITTLLSNVGPKSSRRTMRPRYSTRGSKTAYGADRQMDGFK